jgi:hypothetical protein
MARPTDYTPELLEKARNYLVDYEYDGSVIPSVAGLSEYLGISRTCIYDWAKQEDKKEFSDILGQILSKQERLLINKGLTGDFNSAIAKLALGKHGYSEKSEQTLQGPDGGAISVAWEVQPVSSQAKNSDT